MRYHETTVSVRFNEVDSYHVAWHGHYVAWMEVGRNALAGMFGMDAGHLVELGFMAPVVQLEVKYLRPARYGEELRVRTHLRPTATATLEFVSSIVGSDGRLCASGSSVHALVDGNGVLQYHLPAPVAERLARLTAYLES
jgi:acyl-CoA thioester hydrolase